MSKKNIGTVVGTDTRISGDIQFVGGALIDGYVKGNVRAAGGEETSTLIISEHGWIEGSVVVSHLVLNGMVEGQVCATGHVELGPKARVIGDVQYKLLQMAIGAEINGRLIHESEGYIVQKDTEAMAQIEAVSHR